MRKKAGIISKSFVVISILMALSIFISMTAFAENFLENYQNGNSHP